MTKESSVLTPSELFLSNYQELLTLTAKPYGFGEVGWAEDSRLTSVEGKAGWSALLFALIRNGMPNCAFRDYYNRSDSPDSPDDDFTISSSGNDPVAAAAFVLGVNAYPFTSAAAGGLHRFHSMAEC
jgi:hypothetical protein